MPEGDRLDVAAGRETQSRLVVGDRSIEREKAIVDTLERK